VAKRMKITEQIVAQAKMPERGQAFIRDSETTGFALRLTQGAKTFVFERRIKGRSRRITIGQNGDFSVAKARTAAQEFNLRVRLGEDPSIPNREETTFAELEKAYLRDHAEKHKRPSSVKDDRLYLRVYVPAAWRTRRLSEISTADIERLHSTLGRERGHYAANHAFRLLRCMFNLARSWKMMSGENPATGIKSFAETKRERYLKPDEMKRLNPALIQEQDWRWPALFPLLLYTGARLSEVLFAEWSYVDLNQRIIRFPMTKDGAAHTIPLSEPAMVILSSMPSRGQRDRLFPETTKSVAEKAWHRIRGRAGVPDVRIHDLRHTLASWMVGQGFSLPLIGKALNHANSATTERYAHMDLDPVRAALEQTAKLMVSGPAKRRQRKPSDRRKRTSESTNVQ
jgi:integrase